MKLLILQYYPYQFHQIKSFIDYLGDDLLIVARFTEEESKAGVNLGGFRGINRVTGELDDYLLNPESLMSTTDFEYVIYTGVPFKGLSEMAKCTERGFAVCIGHSIIASRYDASLVMPSYDNVIGMMPECWLSFDAIRKEAATIPGGKFIKVYSAPIVSEVIKKKPEVEVENKIGAIFGCKSAFKTYHKVLKGLKEEFNAEKVKVKFHPLTNMNDPDVINIIQDLDFEILPTDYDKFMFTDSCKYLIGGCSSLLIEAYLRHLHFNTSQHISKFKERRGIELNMPENTIDVNWKGKAPHHQMLVPALSDNPSDNINRYITNVMNSLYLNDGVVTSHDYEVVTCQQLLDGDA